MWHTILNLNNLEGGKTKRVHFLNSFYEYLVSCGQLVCTVMPWVGSQLQLHHIFQPLEMTDPGRRLAPGNWNCNYNHGRQATAHLSLLSSSSMTASLLYSLPISHATTPLFSRSCTITLHCILQRLNCFLHNIVHYMASLKEYWIML